MRTKLIASFFDILKICPLKIQKTVLRVNFVIKTTKMGKICRDSHFFMMQAYGGSHWGEIWCLYFFWIGGPIFWKNAKKGEEANISHKVLSRWDSNLLCGATEHKEEQTKWVSLLRMRRTLKSYISQTTCPIGFKFAVWGVWHLANRMHWIRSACHYCACAEQ